MPGSNSGKILLIMKLTAVFTCLLTLNLSAKVHSQTSVTLRLKQVSLNQVFLEIEKKTSFRFLYNDKIVHDEAKVTLDVKDEGVLDVMKILLKQTSLDFIVRDDDLIVIVDKVKTNVGIPVHGIIKNSKGQPAEGVSVVEKGTQNGTTTNAKGEFSLSVANTDAVLVVSSVGFVTQEVELKGNTNIVVQLTEDFSKMNDVVVIGYGTARKKDLTGAVTTISEKDIQSRPVTNFADALQGRASGVQVAQTGGNLDGRFSIKIRGAGSVNQSISPLIVVDGVPLANDQFSTINPQDIESMTILKDASATAIYGARASNGVVIITTKRGAAGETKINFTASTGVDKVQKYFDVLTTDQQRRLFIAAYANTGGDSTTFKDLTNPAWSVNTNWQKLATRPGWRQSYNVSITGGKPNNSFAVSAGYLKRQGVIINTDITDYFARANNNMAIGKKLKISSSLAATYQVFNNPSSADAFNGGATFEQLVSAHSYTRPYDSLGNLTSAPNTALPYFGNNTNPLIGLTLNTVSTKQTRISGVIKADYEIIRGLTLSGNLGTDILLQSNHNFYPNYSIGNTAINPTGSVNFFSTTNRNWVGDITLTYRKLLGLHSITALAGYSAQQTTSEYYQVNGSGTTNTMLNQIPNQTNITGNSSEGSSGLIGSFVRIQYIYNDRYLLTGTVRRDGSSKFGPNNQYGVFPTAAAAWNISKEEFFKVSWINELKLRIGYGLTGNQNIADFGFLTKAGSSPYAFGNTAVLGNGISNAGQPNLQWEAAKQLDAGFDIVVLNGRINSTIDYYKKTSSKLLVSIPVPLTTGVGTNNPVVNLGSVLNEGFEFAINTQNLIGKFNWTTSFNISTNKNKVLDIGANAAGVPAVINGTLLGSPVNDFINQTQAGQPIGAFYMYRYLGVWQLDEAGEAAATKYNNLPFTPGDARYADLNGDHVIDAQDKQFVGSPQPTYYGGMNNTFSYADFSLGVLMSFSGGNKIYNVIRNLDARGVPFNQQLAEVANWWTPSNPSNIPKPAQGGNTTTFTGRVSDRFLEDGSYLRLSNVSLSYNIPVVKTSRLQEVRFTLAANNLFTLTKYKGMDPASASAGDQISGGLDLTPYPVTRYYYISIAIGF
ncbi:MAG: hypothetical protein BGP14_07455 [Sphingobacteriales bacterium 44-15]|nr:MAG: hypothetical protein BGP14_07455 [Sphingobacteriales bacterium 44-15]